MTTQRTHVRQHAPDTFGGRRSKRWWKRVVLMAVVAGIVGLAVAALLYIPCACADTRDFGAASTTRGSRGG